MGDQRELLLITTLTIVFYYLHLVALAFVAAVTGIWIRRVLQRIGRHLFIGPGNSLALGRFGIFLDHALFLKQPGQQLE